MDLKTIYNNYYYIVTIIAHMIWKSIVFHSKECYKKCSMHKFIIQFTYFHNYNHVVD